MWSLQRLRSYNPRNFQPVGLFLCVKSNFLKYLLQGCLRLPVPDFPCQTSIHDKPWYVKAADFVNSGDVAVAEPLPAPAAQLRQGDGACRPAPQIHQPGRCRCSGAGLLPQEGDQVPRVKTVPHLAAAPTEADVGEGTSL